MGYRAGIPGVARHADERIILPNAEKKCRHELEEQARICQILWEGVLGRNHRRFGSLGIHIDQIAQPADLVGLAEVAEIEPQIDLRIAAILIQGDMHHLSLVDFDGVLQLP